MFRLLRTAATARGAWRLPEATTALNHTMQTSSDCSQPKQQIEDLISHPFLLSLRQRTSYINETFQILKNFTHRTFEDRQRGTYHTWKPIYNQLMINNPDQLTLHFDPEVIGDNKVRRLVKKVYNNKQRKAGYIADRRVGLLCLFRDVIQHLNLKPHQKRPRANREQATSAMHLAVGRMTIDA